MDIYQLIDLHELAKRDAKSYARKRFLYTALTQAEGKHFTGIVGPRGAGKTVLLRQYALENDGAFYLSADVLTAEDDAWDHIQNLKKNFGFTTFLIDEIHFLPDATGLLKRLYDFLDLKIIFSSSVALAMYASAHDLSRRVQLRHLHAFSFREYLEIAHNISLPRLTLTNIIERSWDPEHLRAGRFFDEYLPGGQLPFAIDERDPLPLLRNILDKVIMRDIPSVKRLTLDELDKIRRLLTFVGRAQIDGINYTSLSRNLGITKYKAQQYADCLEQAFILHQSFPTGTNVLREPKILMAPPYRLLYRELPDAAGGLREDFFTETMIQAGISFHYLKSTRGAKTPDYLIEGPEKLVIEIGGKGKGREQFKGIQADRKLIFAHTSVPDEKRIPLFLLGFLP